MNSELQSLIEDYLSAREERVKLDENIAQIGSMILDRVAEGQEVELPGRPGQGIRVQPPPMKFDPAMAEQILTVEQRAAVSVPVINRDRAHSLLPGLLYKQCCRPVGQPSLRLL